MGYKKSTMSEDIEDPGNNPVSLAADLIVQLILGYSKHCLRDR